MFGWFFLLMAACTPSDDRDLSRCGPAQSWQIPSARHNDLVAALQTRFDETESDSLVVALLEGDQITFARAFGHRDPEAGLTMQVTSQTRAASTLKMQTAAMVLGQVEAGLFSLDDTVGTLLPDLDLSRDPGALPTATLHQLLSHQSGIRDYLWYNPQGPAATAHSEAYGLLADSLYMMAPPGTFYNYANPNYMLAGLAASDATGAPYSTLMQQVWEPLCMTATTLDGDAVEAGGNWVTSAVPGGNGVRWTDTRTYRDPLSQPVGYAWTNALDMMRFADFLLHGNVDVLSADGVAAMTTSQVSQEIFFDELGYSYGLEVYEGVRFDDDFYDTPVLYHRGFLPDYFTEIVLLPELDSAAVIMATGAVQDYIDLPFWFLLDDANAPSRPYVPEPMASGLLQAVAGTYGDPFNIGTVEVTVEGEGLHIDAPTLDDFDLAYEHTMTWAVDRTFLWNLQGALQEVTFLEGDTPGQMEWLRHRSFVARRSDPNARTFPGTPDPTRLVPGPARPVWAP